MLTAQGSHAHGGAQNYIVDGKMTGGFAVVAFPAVYRSSGVKTFIVNQNGMIYEKDLGAKTTEIASSMKTYDPDGTWARAHANQFLTLTFPNP
jgi:deoxyxylulose-5-phosphate synthase